MDPERFDAFVHLMVSPRRAVLRRALGGGLAAVFSSAAIEEAAANKRKRRRKRKCRGGHKRTCGGKCVNLATDAANCGECGFVCESGECIHGACTCDAGQIDCLSGCACADRLGGGKVCFKGGNDGTTCDSDYDCPFRRLCFSINKCSIPCTE